MTDEHTRGEMDTDDLIDAWHARLAPLTQAEIDATIKRVSREVEAIGMMYEDELPADMPMEDYIAWFDSSKLVYGVRMGPRYVLTTGQSRSDANGVHNAE